MQDIVLLLAAAAVFAFGWFLMGKLESFLQRDACRRETGEVPPGKYLRIGFVDPLAADSLSGVLETYGESRPGVAVFLSGGTAEELLKGIAAGRLDAVFLPKDVVFSGESRYHRMEVVLSCTPVVMQYGGLAIGPVTQGRLAQIVIWPKEDMTSQAGAFIACLKGKLAAEAGKPLRMIS